MERYNMCTDLNFQHQCYPFSPNRSIQTLSEFSSLLWSRNWSQNVHGNGNANDLDCTNSTVKEQSWRTYTIWMLPRQCAPGLRITGTNRTDSSETHPRPRGQLIISQAPPKIFLQTVLGWLDIHVGKKKLTSTPTSNHAQKLMWDVTQTFT